MKTDIFSFTDPAEFLNFELEQRKSKNPQYSLRAWSRQLGFENPAFFSQVLAKKRKLKLELAQKIGQQMGLAPNETKYFQSLVLLANAQSTEEKALLIDVVESLRPHHEQSHVTLNLDIFKFISDWIHVAILEIFHLKSFDGTMESLVAHLYPEVPPSQTHKAVERLTRLDLVKTTKDGKLKRTKESKYLVDQNIPNEAVRNLHRQMIQRSQDSIEGQGFQERDLRASTICLNNKDYAKAVEILKRAHVEITNLSRTSEAQHVYQLNSQLFKLLPPKNGDRL